MALPTVEDREKVEDLAADPEPEPEPEPTPEPTTTPSAGGRTGASVRASATSSTGLPNAAQRRAVEEKAETSSAESEPEPEPEPDPAPSAQEESGSEHGDTTTMATDFQDPDEELREVSGAGSAGTGTDILASGGALESAAQTISGHRVAKPTIGTFRRLLESGDTDAPSDIIAKYQGQTDPNPGHTTPAEARGGSSATSQATNAAENAGRTVMQAVPFGWDPQQAEGLLDSPAVLAAVAVGAVMTLLAVVGMVDDEAGGA